MSTLQPLLPYNLTAFADLIIASMILQVFQGIFVELCILFIVRLLFFLARRGFIRECSFETYVCMVVTNFSSQWTHG